jgi:hypothetical protein
VIELPTGYVNITVTADQKAIKRWSVYLSSAEDIINQSFAEIAQEYEQALQSNFPKRTGATAASIRVTGSFPKLSVTGNAVFGYVLAGRKGGRLILPVNKLALYWPTIQGGRPVHHARLAATKRRWDLLLVDELKRIARKRVPEWFYKKDP